MRDLGKIIRFAVMFVLYVIIFTGIGYLIAMVLE